MRVPDLPSGRRGRRDGANQWRIIASVLLCVLFVPRAAFARQAASASTQVSRLLTAYEGNDFKTIFDLSYAYQSHLEGIKQSNPQVMWQQLTDEYFRKAEQDYAAQGQAPASTFSVTGGLLAGLQQMAVSASSADNPANCSLRSLLGARPKWKILETRSTHWQDDSTGAAVSGTLVYVEVDFGAPESSPLFGEGLLKKLIVGVTLESPKDLFFSAEAVPKSEALWPNPPLRLLSVQWNTVIGAQLFARDTVLGYNVLGGVPPYRSHTTCGSLSVEPLATNSASPPNASIYGSPEETPTDSLRIEFGEPQQQRFPLPCTVQITDSRGQQDVAHFVVPQLESGLWSPFCWIRNPWYGWKEGLPNARQGCEKLYELQSGAISEEFERGESGLAAQNQPPPPRGPAALGNPPAPRQLPACGNYGSCMQAGESSFRSFNMPTAISDFQSAADLQPNAGDAWVWLGNAYLGNGQDPAAWWDKALRAGANLSIAVCHELAFRPCERGEFSLSASTVSFVVDGALEFTAAPSGVTSRGTFNSARMAHMSFGLEVGRRRYNFDFIPTNVTCVTRLFVQCPQQGYLQQWAVANYVAQAIPKLASGALGAPPTTKQVPSGTGQSTPASSSSSSACATATNLGYAIQDGSHLYTVKGVGPAGPNQVHVFVDETGAVARDADLLQQLALGAWTKERIVDRYNPSSGSGQVRTFLAVSSNLEGWEDATDALARATVESIKAVATGGTSLSTTTQNLTLGVVKNQFTNPKIALAHWARAGLEQSLTDYTEMESLLPAAGATTFKLSDLEKIESLYTEANTLASVNEALAAAIAPTTWQAEFANYLSSAVDELKPAVPASTTLLTLSDVLKLEDIVAATGQSFNAYKQSLDVAQKVSQSDRQSVAQWADAAGAACGAAVAGNTRTPGTSETASIHNVDFRNFSYPSGCARSNPRLGFPAVIPVVDGEWKKGTLGQDYVSYSVGQPLYGKLLGNSEEQAVVPADCFLGNGDDEEIFVYGVRGAQPALVERLTPTDWEVPAWGIGWGTKKIAVENGKIIVTYLAGGYRARPAWTARVALRWNGSRFVRTPMDRKPFVP